MPTKQRYFIPLLLGVFALAGLGGAVAPAHAHAAPVDVSAYTEVDNGANTINLPAGTPIPSGSGSWYSSCFISDANYATLIASNPQTWDDFATAGCVANWGGTGSPKDTSGDGILASDFGPFAIDTALDSWGGFSAFRDGNTQHLLFYFTNGGSGSTPVAFWFGAEFRYHGGITPPVPPDTHSRIDSLTIATSTNTVNITGYWAYASSTVYDSLSITQSSQHLPLEILPYFYTNGDLLATTTGAFNLTFDYRPLPTFAGTGTSTLPIKDALTITAKLYHTDKTAYNCDSIFPIEDDNGNIVECDPRSHALIDQKSATIEDGTIGYSDITTSAGLQSFPEYECGLTALSGCLKNAFIFLFYPAGDTVAQFSTLTLSDRFPFAYAYQVGEIRNAVFNAPQTASSTIEVETPIGNLTFLSKSMMEAVPFASLIKTLLSAVMWFLAVMVIYRRVLASHDNTTHV